jgi:hypothetical protein
MGESCPKQADSSSESMKTPGSFTRFFSFCLTCLVTACGIEDYPYLVPISQSSITRELNSRVQITMPAGSPGSSFTHFTVFYRIYVGETEELSPSRENISAINTVLYNDYTAIEPYIDNTTMGSSTIASVFSGRKYQTLMLENNDIDAVLSNSVLGTTVVFDFSQNPGDVPVLTVNGNPYTLLRSNGNGTFNPRPASRYFINSPELYSPDSLNDNVNADVANKSNFSGSARHTYICMYIVATGLNTQTFTQIFSTPAFAGILRLPNAS